MTIDRPERRNAVDSATAALLLEAFSDFDDDDSLSVAVLTGAGGYFCAGADLKALLAGDRRPVSDDGPGPMGPTRLRLGKPVIAAIEGPAVAGGLELALWCDLRVAARDATLGVYCRRFGVPLVDLGTVRLPRLIGHSRAIDLILTGRGIDGVEAERIGLVNRVVEPGQALAAAVDARPRAGRAAAGVHAQRPAVGARAVGPRRGRGDAQRGGPGTRRRSTAARPGTARRGSRPELAGTAHPCDDRLSPDGRHRHVRRPPSRSAPTDPVRRSPSTHELTMRVGLAHPRSSAPARSGVRVVGGVTTGTVRGHRVNGTIVGPGADWMLIGPDGFGRVDVRLQIETDDGAVIYVRYEGLIELNAASSAALMDRGRRDGVGRPVLPHHPALRDRRRALRVAQPHGVRRPRPGHRRRPRVRGVPGRVSGPEAAAARRRCAGSLHRWSAPVAVALTVLVARAGADRRHAGAVIVYGMLRHRDARGERHVSRAAAVRAAAPAAAPARPRGDLPRHRRDLHRRDRARPRRGDPRRAARAGVGDRRGSGSRSGWCGSTPTAG